MADLEAENLLDQFLPVKEEDENLPEFIKALKPMEPDSGGEKTIPFADHSWGDFVMRVGSVCSTKNEIPFLSDGTVVYRKVFSSTIVLILEEGKGSSDENSWVVAPCEERLASPDGISSEADYSFSHDGFEYLARLDLATEVLESQFDRLLDAIDPTEETFREKPLVHGTRRIGSVTSWSIRTTSIGSKQSPGLSSSRRNRAHCFIWSRR